MGGGSGDGVDGLELVNVCHFSHNGAVDVTTRGRTVTVNAERYTEMIRNFFLRELRRRRLKTNEIWFQQDGATAHTQEYP